MVAQVVLSFVLWVVVFLAIRQSCVWLGWPCRAGPWLVAGVLLAGLVAGLGASSLLKAGNAGGQALGQWRDPLICVVATTVVSSAATSFFRRGGEGGGWFGDRCAAKSVFKAGAGTSQPRERHSAGSCKISNSAHGATRVLQASSALEQLQALNQMQADIARLRMPSINMSTDGRDGVDDDDDDDDDEGAKSTKLKKDSPGQHRQSGLRRGGAAYAAGKARQKMAGNRADSVRHHDR